MHIKTDCNKEIEALKNQIHGLKQAGSPTPKVPMLALNKVNDTEVEKRGLS